MKLLLLFFLTCCSAQKKIIPNELRPYSDLFRDRILTSKKMKDRLDTVDFEIKYYKDADYVGKCYPVTLNGNPKIIINKYYFDKSTESSKISDIMHELGHCVCHLAHTEESEEGGIGDTIEGVSFRLGFLNEMDDLSDGCPSSIMYPIEFSDKCFDAHKDYYYQELKNRCK